MSGRPNRCRGAGALACALAALALSSCRNSTQPVSRDFHDWAPTPPMGWNSWDCFATTVTEAQTRAEAEVMANALAPHGWNTVVVDIQWYEPGATGYGYRPDARLTLDPYGRLLPAPNKFPSARDGDGFRTLADFIHGKGLKFGIHLMRGIPRQAVEENLPILGTSFHAADIADRVNVCPWNGDMYGVDMTRPGAQAYYDSVFALIASWGVDFVKVDDLSRPTIRNEPEIQAVRTAIDATGRAIVLSMSPGATDLHAGAFVTAHANMWRISDDFWDHWSLLLAQFDRLNQWTPWRRPGAWPDADMIPIGTIDLGRKSWFTHDEEVTLLTLWCIARSPLMLGADLTKLDTPTLGLLTNDEVLAVDQASAGGRQLFRRPDGTAAWIADIPGSSDKYLALFNTRDPWVLADSKRLWESRPVSKATPRQQIAFEVPVAGISTLVLVADPSSGRFWWPAVFTDLRWVDAAGHETRADRDYGSHGEQVNGIAVPAGAAALRGTAHLDDAARSDPGNDSLSFSAYGFTANDLSSPGQRVPVDLQALGARVRLRDLWAHEDLGTYAANAIPWPVIAWHGARLYRVSPSP